MCAVTFSVSLPAIGQPVRIWATQTELWNYGSTMSELHAFANSPSYLDVIKLDEERFTDPKKCEYFFSEERPNHKTSSGIRERPNMKEKQIKIPGPDHPISIQRNPARIVVSVVGRVVADTRNALTFAKPTIRPSNTFHEKMSILLSWNRPNTLPTVRIKAIVITTAFPLEEKNRSMPCGPTRIRIPLLRKSKDTSRSIRTESMKSRSNFQRRVSRQRAVVPNEWRKL